MNVDAIIFDKDGTLLDFDAYWISVSVAAIETVLERFHSAIPLCGKILSEFGVNNGVASPDGVLASGTYEDMGNIVFEVLKSHGHDISRSEVINSVIAAYNACADKGEIKPTCEQLSKTLIQLRKCGKKLAVVTTDNPDITEKCLRSLGIYDLFDDIYTDDGVLPTKPDPSCALDFLEKHGIKPQNAIMIGDTLTDVKFARNAGISVIGIAKSNTGATLLTPHTKFIIKKISDIPDILNIENV